jgi:hypothetical protein
MANVRIAEERKTKMKKIEFVASLPDIQAISIGGKTRNTRIKIDIPQSEIAAVVNIMAMDTDKPFKVTIEELEQGDW